VAEEERHAAFRAFRQTVGEWLGRPWRVASENLPDFRRGRRVAGDLAGRFWRVEIGDYEDGEAVPSGELARRLRAKAMRAEQRPGGR